MEPTVCVIEDVHWADEASLDVLTYLVRRVADLPLLLVLSFRDDEVPADHPLRRTLAAVPAGRGRRVGLLPLSLDAVRRLAGSRVDAAAVHAVTGGNPFFVSEVLSGGLDGTPASVRDAVLGRFARLGPAARATAELVSVVPGRIEHWLLEACLPEADVAGCEAQGLLVADEAGDALPARARALGRRGGLVGAPSSRAQPRGAPRARGPRRGRRPAGPPRLAGR